MAFDPDELHLFIVFAEPGAPPDPVEGMSFEDLLVTLPHEQADHNSFRWRRSKVGNRASN